MKKGNDPYIWEKAADFLFGGIFYIGIIGFIGLVVLGIIGNLFLS